MERHSSGTTASCLKCLSVPGAGLGTAGLHWTTGCVQMASAGKSRQRAAAGAAGRAWEGPGVRHVNRRLPRATGCGNTGRDGMLAVNGLRGAGYVNRLATRDGGMTRDRLRDARQMWRLTRHACCHRARRTSDRTFNMRRTGGGATHLRGTGHRAIHVGRTSGGATDMRRTGGSANR